MTTGRSQYDAFSRDYADAAATSTHNALYDRPNVLALAGDVAGLRVLEVGCAAGYLTKELVAGGAEVVAIDVSEGLIALARERFGELAEFHVADVTQPLRFLPDESFDLVVASLVMHYLKDWGQTLGEFRRVLRPDGRFVMSTHHPTMDWLTHDRPNYFETRLLQEEWHVGDTGRTMPVEFYRRPLSAVFGALHAAGFVVEQLQEPLPSPAIEKQDPKTYAVMSANPTFLYLATRRPTAPPTDPSSSRKGRRDAGHSDR